MKIVTENVREWRVASKIRHIKAKHIINILVDYTIARKFLLDTLEGKELLGNDVVICVGEAGEVWQQMPEKLLAKYDVTGIDEKGWMHCTPKPCNAVNCIEITRELLTNSVFKSCVQKPPTDDIYKVCDFYVIGQWGEEVPEIGKNVQFGMVGDFVCRNCTDPTDVWIVRRKLFFNTYVLKD